MCRSWMGEKRAGPLPTCFGPDPGTRRLFLPPALAACPLVFLMGLPELGGLGFPGWVDSTTNPCQTFIDPSFFAALAFSSKKGLFVSSSLYEKGRNRFPPGPSVAQLDICSCPEEQISSPALIWFLRHPCSILACLRLGNLFCAAHICWVWPELIVYVDGSSSGHCTKHHQ